MQLQYRALLAITLALFLSQHIHAYTVPFSLTGSELLKKCSEGPDQEISYCNGYLIGVLDGRIEYMTEPYDDSKDKRTLGICLYGRKDIKIENLRDSVIKMINWNHDRYDDSQAGVAVIDAIEAFYPCSGASNSGPKIFK